MIEGKIEIKDGSKIAYRITGDQSKPMIIFVNGSIFNYRQFDPVLFPALRKAVKEKFSFCHYDYVGFGDSTKEIYNGKIDLLEFSRQHIEMMDELGLESAHHFGYSKGSLISFLVTAGNPDRVASIAGYGNPNLAAGTGEKSRKEFSKRVQYIKGISGIWHLPVDKSNYKLVYDTVFLPTIFKNKSVSRLSFMEKITNWVVRNKLEPMLVGTLIGNIMELYKHYTIEAKSDEKEKYIDAMKKITKPTLLMHGKNDEIVPFEASKLLSEWIETSKLVDFPYDHTSPVLKRGQGKKIMNEYAAFLSTL